MTYNEIRDRAQKSWEEFTSPEHARILIGTGTCGRAAGADEVIKIVSSYIKDKKLDARVWEVGCLGLCYAEPLVELSAPGSPRILFSGLGEGNTVGVLEDYFGKKKINKDAALAVMDAAAADGVPAFIELPVVKDQVRIVLRNCGIIDPEDIDHYVARGGYAGLAKALEISPEDVIEEVKKSGLRGRGGAGFPTGTKWEFCRKASGDHKYMICNADEGDPGAFMDRSVIESDPHSVIEGMAIAARAIGADQGYIYARAEYPLAIVRLRKAIQQAEKFGLLGENILGSAFSLAIRIKEGAGAFVCGEETALIASIEGRRGMPRTRPPFPAQRGLHGMPTNINNVETLANVPVILEKGSDWFAQYGTEKSRGTKTFALAGKVVRTGLIEVPLGITLQKIVFDIGGGVPEGKEIKAVQTGGPSGGCIPANLFDMPVDYEKLAEAGAIMGSGGMVVMDEDTCIVDIARYFIEFTQKESCGKCVPCRLGTRQMLQILDSITTGRGRPEDIELLGEMAKAVKLGALCGLGQTAPNPVLTTIKYYRDEYDEHVNNRCCPAGKCAGLTRYRIDAEKCTGCTVCTRNCPVDAISGEKSEPHAIDIEKCVGCGVCFDKCKFEAVIKSL